MTKLLRKALLTLAAMLFMVPALNAQEGPQQLTPLPVDQEVRIGKLPNGLTYYIRHNETPKGQADFYIAQKVGSILEEDNQRGLAHFLEHMCFNGTENFPGTSLRDWLESIGVKFGANLNAYTSIDQTVYNISNVPIDRQSVQDSCLLILHDWANALTLDPKEIDAERGVIHEEWRRSMAGQMRILENLLPVIYQGERYGYRLPIGTMEVVDNFPPQALRDYYETWYRPDQQGVIVVGDIDPDYIESKIKEMFSDIEMPADAKERVYFDVSDNEGTIYAIGSDPEQKYSVVDVMFKTDPFPNEAKNSMEYLVTKYVINMMQQMLNMRIDDLEKDPNAPFAQAGISYDNFFLAKTKDALDMQIVAKSDIPSALEAVYRELLRAQRGGFTVGEYDRARNEYLSRLEKIYNSRDKRESETYVNEYVDNFLDNEPIPSIETEYQLMSQIAPMIPIEAINSILPELVTENNRIVMVLAPQKEGVEIPTEEQLAAVFAKVDAEEIEPYKDEMKSEPLIPQLPAPGKIVSITDDTQWGAKVLTLSNGVKVVVKPTDYKKDEILFGAIALGGTSTLDPNNANSIIYMPIAMTEHGLGDYTSTDLKKYLQGKQVSCEVSLDDYYREVEGSSTVKDLPTLMELIYMTFVDYTIAPEAFASAQSRYSNILAHQENDPQYVFQKTLQKELFNSPTKQALTSEMINAADRDFIVNTVRNAVSNAADYTFYFVGDIDMDTFNPLVEQYIATLPANAKKANKTFTVNADIEPKTGSATTTETTKMETPQTWTLVFVSADMPYTIKNRYLTSIAGQILSNRLLQKIREEMGATYSIYAGAQLDRLSKNNAAIQIPFPMKPEMKQEVLDEISKAVNDMAVNIAEDELAPTKEYLVKTAKESKDKNAGWLNAMTGAALNGVDTFNGNEDVINSITVDDVKKFVKDMLSQGNYRVVLLDPAE